MTPAGPLLDYRQRKYVLRTLKLPSNNPANQLLSLTLKYGDGNVQSDQYSEEDLSWIHSEVKSVNLTQKLVKNLIKELNLDSSERFKKVLIVKKLLFPKRIIILEKEIVISKTKKLQNDLTLWTDDLRTNSDISGVEIT